MRAPLAPPRLSVPRNVLAEAQVGLRTIRSPFDGVVVERYLSLGERVVVSQRAHLCAGTHDVRDPNFQLVARPIRIGDQRLGGPFLLGLVVRPERLEPPLPRGIALDEAEQEEQPQVGLPERVALVVQEDVAVVGSRQRSKAGELGHHRIDPVIGGTGKPRTRRSEQFERRRSFLRCGASLHLQRGLLDHSHRACGVEFGHLHVE